MKKLLASLFILLSLISCGQDSSLFSQASTTSYSVEPASEEEYTYEFTTYRCTTGQQVFSTLDAACKGLTDDDLNNSCAETQREELFESAECSGSFS